MTQLGLIKLLDYSLLTVLYESSENGSETDARSRRHSWRGGAVLHRAWNGGIRGLLADEPSYRQHFLLDALGVQIVRPVPSPPSGRGLPSVLLGPLFSRLAFALYSRHHFFLPFLYESTKLL